MQIYTRYKGSRKRPSSSGGWFYGLLTAVCLGLVGWLLWHSRPHHQAPPPAPVTPKAAAPVAPTPAPPPQPAIPSNALVLHSNLPPVVPPAPPSSNLPTVVELPAPGPLREPAYPRSPTNAFEAQVALARQGISPGSLDGSVGSQTRAAVRAYQAQKHLPETGLLDRATAASLRLEEPAMAVYIVTEGDLQRLLPVSTTWLGKSEQERLDYATILELVAEQHWAHPNLIRRLNPGINWANVAAGTALNVPAVSPPPVTAKAASILIHLGGKTLEAFDASGNLLAHFPCSIARKVEKRPVGELQVIAVIPNPNYTFNPEVFPESEEGRQLGRKLVLPTGPNNPVGVAWIGLSLPGYGIHGTPNPEEVGRTESHGCFRLANWNAEYLARLVAVGTPVTVEP